MSRTVLLFSVPALSLVALGCGSQADTSTYRGEPLATLTGTVESASSATFGTPIDAALLWGQAQFGPDTQLIGSLKWVGESAPVTGQFPANFTLDIYQPPPTSVLIACPSSSAHIALAALVAVPANTDLDAVTVDTPLAGHARNQIVLYLDTDEPAGWSCFPNLGFDFAPTKGFHVLDFVPNSVAPRAFGACYSAAIEAPQGLATPIAIVLGHTKLPNAACSTTTTAAADGGIPSAQADASVPPGPTP